MTQARSTPSSPRTTNRPPLFARTMRCAALLALTITMLASGAHATSAPATPELPAVQEALAGLAVPFEQNTGQFAPEVAYLARTFAGSVFVTRDGRLVYSLPGREIEAAADDAATESRLMRRQRPAERGPGWAALVARAHTLGQRLDLLLGQALSQRDALRRELDAGGQGARALKAYRPR